MILQVETSDQFGFVVGRKIYPQRSFAKCCLGNTGLKTAFAAVQNSCSALPVGTCELM
jgi:hypothetical protein